MNVEFAGAEHLYFRHQVVFDSSTLPGLFPFSHLHQQTFRLSSRPFHLPQRLFDWRGNRGFHGRDSPICPPIPAMPSNYLFLAFRFTRDGLLSKNIYIALNILDFGHLALQTDLGSNFSSATYQLVALCNFLIVCVFLICKMGKRIIWTS